MYETTTRIESFQDLARILKEAIAIHCVVKQGLSSWFHYIVLGQSWNSHRGNEEVINKSTRTENKETNNRDKFESDIGTGLFSLENDQYPAIEEQFGKAYALFKKKEETEVCSIATNNCEHFVDYILRGKAVFPELCSGYLRNNIGYVHAFRAYKSHVYINIYLFMKVFLKVENFSTKGDLKSTRMAI